MIDEQFIRLIVRQNHASVLWLLKTKFQYEMEDVVQECQLYWVKHPHWEKRFTGRLVQLVIVDLLRRELGQPRRFCTHEAYKRGSERYARLCAENHSFDNPHDPITQMMTVEPQVSDLPPIVAAAMEVLTLREWWIVVERYWFDHSQPAIGRRLKIGGSWVNQLLARALPKLRRALPPKGDVL